MQRCLGAVSLLLCLSPCFAYYNGAGNESCYDHRITHLADLGGGVFVPSDTVACSAPCSFQLSVVRQVLPDVKDINTMGEFNFSLGATYEIKLRATLNGFLGFLIQAREFDETQPDTFTPSSTIVGTWGGESADYRPLMCKNSSTSTEGYYPNSATQRDAELFRGEVVPFETILRWTAPSDAPDGYRITFWYTVVQQLLTHFFPVKGPVGTLVIEEPPTTMPPTTLPPTTMSSTTMSSTTMSSTDMSSTDMATATKPSPAIPDGPSLSQEAIIGIGVGAGVGGLLLIVVLVLVVVIIAVSVYSWIKSSSKGKKPSRVSVLWTNDPPQNGEKEPVANLYPELTVVT